MTHKSGTEALLCRCEAGDHSTAQLGCSIVRFDILWTHFVAQRGAIFKLWNEVRNRIFYAQGPHFDALGGRLGATLQECHQAGRQIVQCCTRSQLGMKMNSRVRSET